MEDEDGVDGAMPFLDPTKPFAGESLLGLFARAAARNSIGSIRQALLLNGINPNPAEVVQADGQLRSNLADIIGCNASDIDDRAMIRRTRKTEKNKVVGTVSITWGEGKLSLRQVDTKYRSMAPATYSDLPFHREEWMLRYLPFCPISFERLVDECARCGTKQRWGRTKGLGNCDECGKRLQPSNDDALAERHHPGYKLIASLSSREPGIVEKAFGSVSPNLRNDRPTDLINLAFVIGRYVVPEGHELDGKKAKPEQARRLAACMAEGGELLRNWPDGFRRHLSETFDRQISALGSRANVVARLVNAKRASDDAVAIIRRDLPELCNSYRKSASSLRSAGYPIREFLIQAKLKSPQFKILKNAESFSHLEVTGKERKSVHLPYDMAVDIIKAMNGSTAVETASWRWSMPKYAFAQMTSRGILLPAEHQVFVDLSLGQRIANDSMADFLTALDDVVLQPDVAKGKRFKSAAMLLRRYPGQKPWAKMWELIFGKKIDCILQPNKGRAGHLRFSSKLLLDADMFQTNMLSIEPSGECTGGSYSQFDAAEVLGVTTEALAEAIKAGEVRATVGRYKSVTISQNDVLELAERYMAFGELAWILGEPFIPPSTLTPRMKKAGLNKYSLGYIRDDVLKWLKTEKS